MTERPWLVLRRHPLAADALLAAALVAMELVFALITPRELWSRSLPVTVVWSVACAAPLVLRRVAPWPAIGAAVATLGLPAVTGLGAGVQGLTFAVLTFTVAARWPARRAALAAVVLWVPVAVANLVAPVDGLLAVSPTLLVLNNLLVGLLSYAVGRVVQARQAANRALRERARVAEERQRTLAEQAVADERRRIARELHDVVAHHVSVMGVLATGARRVLRRDPDAADEAIGTIEETGRATLRELRRLLDVLRTDAEPDADLTPQPGLAGIEALTDQVRDAGLPVTLRVDGDPVVVEEGVALAIYRIVQEALTNALKHAGAATAEVRIGYDGAAVVVEVVDDGRGPAPGSPGVGHGLVGMRERVGLYGGVLQAGARSGGGFRVCARIPVEQPGPVPA
ncbi:sensor histidine kinase [Micromonospora sp. 15K316]|uniref:sensor histidine kinase n=1 Tax=Micromonospora sp. 15K316 TaxID=2530376 RepID=UPI001042E05E|nr:sensor histidine kinase [Micromonospora sp. 15K316]TDC36696.1 sensor histidine kinase [Micromonospora sp. 15K316]